MQREEEEGAKNGHNRGEQEKKQHDEEEEEKAEEEEEETEYVVLDLDEVFNGAAVPANCPYTLTGLDTMAPVLTLGNGLRLIGEYEETMGSVLIFSESEDTATHEHNDERDFPTPIDPDTRVKEVKKRVQSVCKLERRLKFRVMQSGI
jgi:general transcription factor 3C polypeptide 6